MTLEAGHQMGPYEIVGVLGRGGMGTVYRALDGRLQRQVALKFLHAGLETTGAGDWNRRRLQEAWIAMECVDGHNLRSRVTADGLPPETVVHIGGQVADGLAHAHAHGVLVLRNQPHTEQSDLWSLGVLLYELLTGTLPLPEEPASNFATGDRALRADRF